MWPGRTGAPSVEAGSAATPMDRARSAALIPVVTPSRASKDTWNAVLNMEVFCRAMGGRSSALTPLWPVRLDRMRAST